MKLFNILDNRKKLQDEIKISHRQKTTTAYKGAGTEFLASKLGRVFGCIKNEEQRILHNDMVDEVDTLIGDNCELFLKEVAKIVLELSKRG
jgi:hypothetical protein